MHVRKSIKKILYPIIHYNSKDNKIHLYYNSIMINIKNRKYINHYCQTIILFPIQVI